MKHLLLTILALAFLSTAWSQSNEYEYVIEDEFEPPVPSINYLTETGVGLRQGEVYYQNILLFGQKFGFGITDHFSINTGLELYSIFEGQVPVILVAPKFTFNEREDQVKFGVGSNFLLIPEIGSGGLTGSLYGLVTFGDFNNNFTAGLGLGYDNNGFANVPVIQLSGQLRVTENLALVLDSLTAQYDDEYFPVGSVFIRLLTKNFVIDLGGVVALDGGGGFPLANFAVKLN